MYSYTHRRHPALHERDGHQKIEKTLHGPHFSPPPLPSEAGPGRFGRQVSVTDIYHTIPHRTLPSAVGWIKFRPSCTVFSHGPMRNIGFLGRWGTYVCPQCLPSEIVPIRRWTRTLWRPGDIVPIRSWTRTLRPPGIRHRHLPYHTIPYHTIPGIRHRHLPYHTILY